MQTVAVSVNGSQARILSMTGCDIVFQFRHGFYYAYAFVTAVYAILLANVPDGIRDEVGILLVFADTSVLGLFFVGAIVLLERDQGTLQHLFVTPLRVHEYLVSKAVSLAVLSAIASAVVGLAAWGLDFRPLPFFAAVLLSSTVFTWIGVALATRSQSLNAFLIGTAACVTPACLPLLEYLDLASSPLLRLLPTAGTLALLNGSLNGMGISQAVIAILPMLIWASIAFLWADRWFRRHIISSIGGDKWEMV